MSIFGSAVTDRRYSYSLCSLGMDGLNIFGADIHFTNSMSMDFSMIGEKYFIIAMMIAVQQMSQSGFTLTSSTANETGLQLVLLLVCVCLEWMTIFLAVVLI